MSQQNLVTVSITPEELKQISGAIDTLRTTLLPKLKALKPDERMELPKMGDKTVAFVKKALEHCTQNPELAPQYLVTCSPFSVPVVEGKPHAVLTINS